MKWRTGGAGFININDWHRWFAWYPVCVHIRHDGKVETWGTRATIEKTWVWLACVWRRGRFASTREYCAIKKEKS